MHECNELSPSLAGYSNASTTMNIYAHALNKTNKVAAEKIEAIMFKNKDEDEAKSQA